MRISMTTVLVPVVGVTIMSLGSTGSRTSPAPLTSSRSCPGGILSGLVITFLGAAILAALKSRISAYVLLVGALTIVATTGTPPADDWLSIAETFESLPAEV